MVAKGCLRVLVDATASPGPTPVEGGRVGGDQMEIQPSGWAGKRPGKWLNPMLYFRFRLVYWNRSPNRICHFRKLSRGSGSS